MTEHKFSQRQEKFHSFSCCVLCVTDSPALKSLVVLFLLLLLLFFFFGGGGRGGSDVDLGRDLK